MPKLSFFAPGNGGYYLLIAVFIAGIAAVLAVNARRKQPRGRAADLQKTYAHMTRALLDETPDDAVVTAVVANLMGKLEPRRPDPLLTIPALSRGRSAVYFVWMLCKETEKNGVAALRRRPANRFAEMGAEGLQTVGATASAAAVRAYLSPEEDDADGATALAAALAKEQPLSLCRDYIRAFPEEFLDG